MGYSRDNSFTPNKGLKADIIYNTYQNWTLSDFDYNYYEVDLLAYSNILNNPILGFKFDAKFTSGKVPTFFKPYADMRGIPIMKYQGNQVMTFETEERINISSRSAIVVFGGAALTSNTPNGIDYNYETWTAGVGYRYKIARLLGIYTGVDFAFSENEFAWYITFANAW